MANIYIATDPINAVKVLKAKLKEKYPTWKIHFVSNCLLPDMRG